MKWIIFAILFILPAIESAAIPTDHSGQLSALQESKMVVDCSAVDGIGTKREECEHMGMESVNRGICWLDINTEVHPCPCLHRTDKDSYEDRDCKARCPVLHAQCREVTPTTTSAPSSTVSSSITPSSTPSIDSKPSTTTPTIQPPIIPTTSKTRMTDGAIAGLCIGLVVVVAVAVAAGCIYIARTDDCPPGHDCRVLWLLKRILKCKRSRADATICQPTDHLEQNQAHVLIPQQPVPPHGP